MLNMLSYVSCLHYPHEVSTRDEKRVGNKLKRKLQLQSRQSSVVSLTSLSHKNCIQARCAIQTFTNIQQINATTMAEIGCQNY